MPKLDLVATARAMVAPGKGILAADESFPTIEKRFKQIDIPSTEEHRRAYREMLFTTPGVGDFISGVITFEEACRRGLAERLEVTAAKRAEALTDPQLELFPQDASAGS